jgi:hypothetical protein
LDVFDDEELAVAFDVGDAGLMLSQTGLLPFQLLFQRGLFLALAALIRPALEPIKHDHNAFILTENRMASCLT